MASRMIAAATPQARKPQNWSRPTRKAPEPPVVATSASECPANDWPRVTVNTPTTPEVIATTVPTRTATRTGLLDHSPGSNRKCMSGDPAAIHRVRLGGGVVVARVRAAGVLPGLAGHDDHPAVD